MAFADLTLATTVQESQDAMQLKIWDASTWNGESGIVTEAKVVIEYYDSDNLLVSFDPYELIAGGVKTKFNEFLDRSDGHVIELADLLIAGVAPTNIRFTDGYFVVTLHVTDGTYGLYAAGGWPKYANNQAFLAKNRFMARKMSKAILAWPMTDAVRIANKDMFLQRMYLDAAEDAADNGNLTEFLVFINLINAVFNVYNIEEAW